MILLTIVHTKLKSIHKILQILVLVNFPDNDGIH